MNTSLVQLTSLVCDQLGWMSIAHSRHAFFKRSHSFKTPDCGRLVQLCIQLEVTVHRKSETIKMSHYMQNYMQIFHDHMYYKLC